MVEKGKSVGNMNTKEAIQACEFDDGYLEMFVWEIKKNTEKSDSCMSKVRMVGTIIVLGVYQL